MIKMFEVVEITVSNLDLKLLKNQRDAVLYSIGEAELLRANDGYSEHIDLLDGVVSLLDHMLDIGEDYKKLRGNRMPDFDCRIDNTEGV